MKFIFSLLMAIFIFSISCSAADLDSVDFYSFDSLSPMTASALDYAVMPLAATSWDTSDQTALANIRNAFYFPNSNYQSDSIIGWVKKLADNSINFSDLSSVVTDIEENFRLNVSAVEGSLIDTVRDLETLLDTLNRVTVPAGNLYLEEINDAIQNDTYSLKSLLQSIWVDTGSIDTTSQSLLSYWTANSSFGHGFINSQGNYISEGTYGPYKMDYILKLAGVSLTHEGVLALNKSKTIYSLVKQLQETLASDDDVALSQSQKANRKEIEDSFLTGSSGSTSLGVSDFAGLSDVGGSVRDSLSLDGNASLTSFTSGLSAADTYGQGWFSETTRSQLDTVSASVTYSLRDPDPYNMSGWEDRYYWLSGDDD